MRSIILMTAVLTLAGCGDSRRPPSPLAAADVSYDPADPVRVARVFRPGGASAGPRPWILGIHGGAFMIGGRADLEGPARELVAEGYVVVSVDYHLTTSPGGTWPAPLRDCQAALRYFRAHAAELGLDPDRFAVMGGSAGGCLATHLGLEDDPVDGSHARYVVDIAGEQDLRLLGACMSNHDQITALLLGHPGPWAEAELLGPSNVGRARPDVEFFIVHGELNDDTYVANSDLLAAELRAAGASVDYERVPGSGMWAVTDPAPNAARHAWLRARLRP